MSWSTCKHCGQKIKWAQMPGGNWLPTDPEFGGIHECVPFERGTDSGSSCLRWQYADEDFCRPTTCPTCGASVFFVRHNGGSVWFDELGYPWPKHECFDDNGHAVHLRRSLKYPGQVFGVIIETEPTRPGAGGRVTIRCSDGAVINEEFDFRTRAASLIGILVLIDPSSVGRLSFRLVQPGLYVAFEDYRPARLIRSMRKISRRHRHFWVGTLKRRDSKEVGLVVYDLLALPFERREMVGLYVRLYEVGVSTAGEFREAVVSNLIGGVDEYSDQDIENAVNAYCLSARIDID